MKKTFFIVPIILQINWTLVFRSLALDLFRSALGFNKYPFDNWVVAFDFKVQTFYARLDI
jgi:hypothetical protein